MEIKEARAILDKELEALDAGRFWENHKIGDELPFNLGPEGDLGLLIAGREADELADGTGRADVTLLTKFNTRSFWPMNCRWATEWEDGWMSGTGAIGGWAHSDMREGYVCRIISLIAELYTNVFDHIALVTKYTESRGTDGKIIHNEATPDLVWPPSFREVFGGDRYETMGPEYTELLKDAKARRRFQPDHTSAEITFLRSVNPNYVNIFATVDTSGSASNNYANHSRGLWFGFCIHRK